MDEGIERIQVDIGVNGPMPGANRANESVMAGWVYADHIILSDLSMESWRSQSPAKE